MVRMYTRGRCIISIVNCIIVLFHWAAAELRIVPLGSKQPQGEAKGKLDLQCVFPRGFLKRACGACDYSHV